MDRIYGTVVARKANAKKTIEVSIPEEAVKELAIRAGDKFVVGLTREGLTYQKRTRTGQERA